MDQHLIGILGRTAPQIRETPTYHQEDSVGPDRKEWFAEFESARSAKKKKELATNICNALDVHAKIEDEIFYPAFLKATKDKDMHHQAVVEHEAAKKLIAEIESSDSSDNYYDSKVHVLSEMIKHHVKEEDQKDGMFDEAKASKKMDLKALGAKLYERKNELMAEIGGS